MWAGYWLLAAVLFLLPANRVADSVSGAVTGMAPGEPSWYGTSSPMSATGSAPPACSRHGSSPCVSSSSGSGPLLFRRFEVFLALGALLSLLFWLTGQGLGGVLTGSGTDPNSGPLVVVLAFAMVPTVVADRIVVDPATRWAAAGTRAVGSRRDRRPLRAPPGRHVSGRRDEQQPGGMSGMRGMSRSSGSSGSSRSMRGMESGSETANNAHCSAGNNGAPGTAST